MKSTQGQKIKGLEVSLEGDVVVGIRKRVKGGIRVRVFAVEEEGLRKKAIFWVEGGRKRLVVDGSRV